MGVQWLPYGVRRGEPPGTFFHGRSWDCERKPIMLCEPTQTLHFNDAPMCYNSANYVTGYIRFIFHQDVYFSPDITLSDYSLRKCCSGDYALYSVIDLLLVATSSTGIISGIKYLHWLLLSAYYTIIITDHCIWKLCSFSVYNKQHIILSAIYPGLVGCALSLATMNYRASPVRYIKKKDLLPFQIYCPWGAIF